MFEICKIFINMIFILCLIISNESVGLSIKLNSATGQLIETSIKTITNSSGDSIRLLEKNVELIKIKKITDSFSNKSNNYNVEGIEQKNRFARDKRAKNKYIIEPLLSESSHLAKQAGYIPNGYQSNNIPNVTRTTESTSLSNTDYDSYSTNEEDEFDKSSESKYIAPTIQTVDQVNQQNENYSSSKNSAKPINAKNDTNMLFSINVDESAPTFVISLFSHIDKQWKFAEVIVIIVVSAILNLVTIIGNIMVLISFKMDRS